MSKYHIVSIDGGGIRGLVTTILLQRIIATPGLENFLESIDLVAGTSTGGLLSLGIGYGIDLDMIRDLYVKSGPKIFDDSWLDNLVDIGKLRGADYSFTFRAEISGFYLWGHSVGIDHRGLHWSRSCRLYL